MHIATATNYVRIARRLAALAICLYPLATYPNDVFVKDASNGCAVFKPNLKPGESVVWRGACPDGFAGGPGMAKWTATNGSTVIFEGAFAHGKLQGEGKMTASGGDVYVGGYRDGQRQGRGTYVSSNGDRYEGPYVDNQRHGRGSLTTASGQRIDGDWVNGVQVGAKSSPSTIGSSSSSAAVVALPRPAAAPWQQAFDEAAEQRRQAQQQATEERQQAQQQAAEQRQQRELESRKAEEVRAQEQLAAAELQRQRLVEQHAAYDRQQMQDRVVFWMFMLSPLLLTVLVQQLKWNRAVTASDAIGGWIGHSEIKAAQQSGYFASFVKYPFLWSANKLYALSSKINNQFLKAGVRLAFFIYLTGLTVYLVFMVTIYAIAFAIIVGVFWIIATLFGVETKSNRTSRKATVYSGSSFLTERVTGRVDADGNVYEGSNVFNERKVGRVDDEGNRYEGTNVFNEQKVGHTDKDGNIIEGTNIFNEQKMGRIDEAGNVFEGSNVFNERKTGRVEKKEG